MDIPSMNRGAPRGYSEDDVDSLAKPGSLELSSPTRRWGVRERSTATRSSSRRSIVAGAIDDRAAAAAKLYVGVALIVAYFNDVVRVPVLVAGSVELVVAGLLLSRSIARRAKAD